MNFNLDHECQAAMSRVSYAAHANANWQIKKMRKEYADRLKLDTALAEYERLMFCINNGLYYSPIGNPMSGRYGDDKNNPSVSSFGLFGYYPMNTIFGF